LLKDPLMLIWDEVSSKEGISSGKQFTEYLEIWRAEVFAKTENKEKTKMPPTYFHKATLAFILCGPLSSRPNLTAVIYTTPFVARDKAYES